MVGNDTVSREAVELFLLRLQYREGRQIALESSHPLVLEDPASVYVVSAGKADLFVVRVSDGQAASPRRHVLRAESGTLLFGMDVRAQTNEYQLVVTGAPGTKLLRVRLKSLLSLASDPEYTAVVAFLLDGWIATLSSALIRAGIPQEATRLVPSQSVRLVDGAAATPAEGILWVRCAEGSALFIADPALAAPADGGFLPLSRFSWLTAFGTCVLEAIGTEQWFERDPDWSALAHMHRLALTLIIRNARLDELADEARLRERTTTQDRAVQAAFRDIAALLAPQAAQEPAGSVDTNPLVLACRLVGQAMDVEVKAPLPGGADAEQPTVWTIARASNIRAREVALTGRWWRQDSGPLIGFLKEDGRPIALLQRSPQRYVIRDPLTRSDRPVTAREAATIDDRAYMFYRPFPTHALGIRDVLRYSASVCRREIATILLAGLGAGLLALAPPIVTGYIVDTVIPSADRGRLVLTALVLLVVTVVMTLFRLTQSIAVLRIEGKVRVQAAVWDRLLNLPVPFFRRYSAGDLSSRAMGINSIQQLLSGPILNSMLIGVFSIFNLVLLFYYSVLLALIAVVLVVIASAATIIAGTQQVRRQRALQAVQGHLNGLVLQVLTGITKFRITGAENRAFVLWAREFAEQRRLTFESGQIKNYLATFNAAFPILTTATIFGMLAISRNAGLTPGKFLAFNSAFGQLISSGLQLSSALIQLLGAIPTYERAKPILETLPEVVEGKAHPGTLRGELEVSHVSFRYDQDGAMILKDVSLHARAGEFIALVGPSGSGKSTMLRLLLGMDMAAAGAISYDGQDLSTLDVREVRQQIGSVLQTSKVSPGPIVQNIIGTSLLTVDDAWEAARMAGLEDDIKRMPMGMYTVVSETGGTFSGGQRQRMLIARAIARRPRIIFFDEATSALDNRTQEQVSRSLERLSATRVVIAHRLSTIINADRIYVFQNGEVVQSGTYGELMAQPGLFADLAKRQLG